MHYEREISLSVLAVIEGEFADIEEGVSRNRRDSAVREVGRGALEALYYYDSVVRDGLRR